ncbi:hypothetical protein [Vibrio phage BONAISHI]|nr:hypothetical protein [Vibrio phage BONAISHI]
MKYEPIYVTPLVALFFRQLVDQKSNFKAYAHVEENTYLSFTISDMEWRNGPRCYLADKFVKVHMKNSSVNELQHAEDKLLGKGYCNGPIIDDIYESNVIPALKTDVEGRYYLDSPCIKGSLTDLSFKFLNDRSSEVDAAWASKFSPLVEAMAKADINDLVMSTVYYRIDIHGNIEICAGLKDLIPVHRYDWALNRFVVYEHPRAAQATKYHIPSQNLNFILGKGPDGERDISTKWYFDKFDRIED